MMSFSRDLVVGVVGAGTMGAGIAQVAASAGHKTIVSDANGAAITKAREGLRKTFSKLVEKGKMTDADAKEVLSKIQFSSDLNDFKNCGFIIEAIVEDLQVKQNLFSQLEKIVSADCVLATNTSSLSVTSIASACSNPERVLGVHFFNPAALMPLVEIIGGVSTSSQQVNEAKDLISKWGKTTVVARDTPGFIVNRVARPFYGEAIRIYEEGIADFATIDNAMREHGFKMGPFELMDLIGNDINYIVTETVWKQMFYDEKYKPSLTQKRLFEAKHFGRKVGKGYYSYVEGATMPQAKQDKVLGEKIFMRILAMLINEAADALYYNVATKEDLDLAMTKGVNYPKGLLKWCDEIEGDKILALLNEMKDEYSEGRYRPSVLLKKIVKEKTRFYA
jgi:3-hydroxybutyryl-CoA dehydrogenase